MLKDLLISVSSQFSNSKSLSKSLLVLPFSDSDDESSSFLSRSTCLEKNEPAVILTKVTPRDYWEDIENNKSNSLPKCYRKQSFVSPKKVPKKPFAESDDSGPINLLVVGDSNVGKSALTVRFITKRYIGDYIKGETQTYDYFYPNTNKEQQKIIFKDEHSCQNKFQSLTSQFSEDNLTWADGVILVYDVGDVASFEYAKKAISLLSRTHDENNLEDSMWFKPVLVLGNKRDIIRRRRVHEHDVREAAKAFPHWVSYHQVSASEDYESVARSINELVSHVQETRASNRASTKESNKHGLGLTTKNICSKINPELNQTNSEEFHLLSNS